MAVHALREIDLEVGEGELIVLLGPSGSGKSTLMHVCAGLDSATSGTVYIGDVDLTALKDNDLTRLRRLDNLTPGDFAAVARQNRFRPLATASEWVAAMESECRIKPGARSRPAIGFGGAAA